jgi:hypothetical protein
MWKFYSTRDLDAERVSVGCDSRASVSQWKCLSLIASVLLQQCLGRFRVESHPTSNGIVARAGGGLNVPRNSPKCVSTQCGHSYYCFVLMSCVFTESMGEKAIEQASVAAKRRCRNNIDV